MAKRKRIRQPFQLRDKRTFSESFKKSKVREIESGITKPYEVSKQYEVSSTSVYRWIHKYGTNMKKPNKTIVEAESDTRKLLELKQKIAELERLLGQKQIEIDFKQKLIELAEQEYGVDIKKKFGGKQ